MTPKTNFLPSEISGNTPTMSPKSYYIDRLQHFDRRASDSSCLMRNVTDVVSRINLAEEIKKLSDKLLKINRLQLRQNHSDSTDPELNAEDYRNINISQTNSATESPKNGLYYLSSTTTVHRSSVDLGLPKRKFKFSSMNRDVPIPVVVTQSETPNIEESPIPSAPNPPSLTSNLLHLLDKYENEKYFPRGVDSIHRKSLSVEWSENGSLSQMTMKNVSNFIETSRNAQQTTSKMITSKLD